MSPAASPRKKRSARAAAPGVAVIIPLHAGASFIEHAVESALGQSLAPQELLVVDDGSTDDGPAVVDALASRHPLVRLVHQPHRGAAAALNLGVRLTQSPLIAPLAQHDAWYPGHLARLSAAFARSPRLGWACGDVDELDESGQAVARGVLAQTTGAPGRTLASLLSPGPRLPLSATVISRAAWQTVGGFDERLDRHASEDFFLRVFRAGYGSTFVAESLATWRPGSDEHPSPHRAPTAAYLEKLLGALGDGSEEHQALLREVVGPRFAAELAQEARRALLDGDEGGFEEARAALEKLAPWLTLTTRARAGLLGLAPFSVARLFTLAREASR